MSASVNVHATGRFEPVRIFAESLYSEESSGDFMLSITTMVGDNRTADLTIFLSSETGKQLVTAVAGYLGLKVDIPEEKLIDTVCICGHWLGHHEFGSATCQVPDCTCESFDGARMKQVHLRVDLNVIVPVTDDMDLDLLANELQFFPGINGAPITTDEIDVIITEMQVIKLEDVG